MKHWSAPVGPIGLATALSVLIVAASAQTPAPTPKRRPPKSTTAVSPKPSAPMAKLPAMAPVQQQTAAPAGQQIQLLYSPWTKFCTRGKEADAKEMCLIGKDGHVETGRPLVSAVLIQPESGPNVLRVTLPLTVQLQRGTRVMIDQTRLASLTSDTQSTPYTICFVNGCMADYQATPEVINQLRKGQSLWVQGFSMAGEFINLPLPLEEFGKALDGPPTDPKALEEQQKKMQDELKRHADELRRRFERQQGAAVQPGK
jgi:invasion protein IalB